MLGLILLIGILVLMVLLSSGIAWIMSYTRFQDPPRPEHERKYMTEKIAQIRAFSRGSTPRFTPASERFNPEDSHPILEMESRSRYEFAVNELRKHTGKYVLDAPCGTGYGSETLRFGGFTVTGIDCDRDSITEAARMYPLVEFVEGDIRWTALDENKYDAIVSFEGIEHVAEGEKVLKEFHRLLKNEGVLILSTPNRLTYYAAGENPFHVREYAPEELSTMLEMAGFVKVQHYGYQLKDTKIHKLYHNRWIKIYNKIKGKGPKCPPWLRHKLEKLLTGGSTTKGIETSSYAYTPNNFSAGLMLFTAQK